MAKAAKKAGKAKRIIKASGKVAKKATKGQKGAPKPSSDFIGWLFYSK